MSDDEKNKKQPLNSSLLKGFIAGVLFSHINKRFVIGALIGTLGGMFAEQNYKELPNIKLIANDWIEHIKEGSKPRK